MNLEDKEKRYIQSDNDNRADSQADRANRSDITDIAARDNSSGEMEIDLRALLYMLSAQQSDQGLRELYRRPL